MPFSKPILHLRARAHNMNLGTSKSTNFFSSDVEEVTLLPSQPYPISPDAYDNIVTFFIKFVNNIRIGPLSNCFLRSEHYHCCF